MNFTDGITGLKKYKYCDNIVTINLFGNDNRTVKI